MMSRGRGLVMLVLALAPAAAHAADLPVLAREQILIVPVGLQTSPAQQTVPKNTATAVNTLVAGGAGAAVLPADALVFAQLRGPAFGSPIVLTARPNESLAIPPLALTGLYVLENIRLVSGGRTLLQAVPDAVTVEVIDKVLVSEVTSRPLTAQEIKDKGIVVDQTNFQVVNFTAGFGVESHRVSIDFPMIVPTARGPTAPPTAPAVTLPPLQQQTATVSSAQLPQLQLALQAPSVSVSGMLLRVEDTELEDRFLIPPIPGVIVIPGNIAFLNQFFSVLLLVSNVAPGTSNLVVRDISAEIVLPAGADTVPDTSDDPLRMARLGTPPVAQSKVQLVVQVGPDGKRGTADDVPFLAPGQTGNAEFLVEGRREGTHRVQIKITGTLDGLPIGPVKISGSAIGTVEVRNPTFALTLAHPATVSAGEQYDFSVIVTNTSSTPANLVTLSLLPRSISGAVLQSSDTVQLDTIAAGDSATATFRLLAQQTGTVTSTSFTSDGIPGKFELTTAVGALGIPMSPNELALPPAADALPAAIRDAAIGLLGQAFALATSPVTPAGLLPISQQIVYERATDVAGAGQRLGLGESLPSVVRDLTLDLLGNSFTRIDERFPDDASRERTQHDYLGFDTLLRQSNRGATLLTALGAVFAQQVSAQGPLDFQAAFAQAATSRSLHLSAITGSSAGPAPVAVSVVNPASRRLGTTAAGGAVTRDVPFGALFSFDGTGTPRSQMALVATPEQGSYSVELVGRATGMFDLGLVVPEGNRLRHLVWQDVPIAPGQKARVAFTIGGDNQYLMEIDDTGDGVPDRIVLALASELLSDTGPSVIGAVQVVTGKDDLSRFGQLVGVIFSEEISAASSQTGLDPASITNYVVEGNQVLGAALQPGGRVLLLSLRDGIGPFVPRTLTVRGVIDLLGNPLSPVTVPIVARLSDGSALAGQVKRGDGTPVPRARIRLAQITDLERTITVKDADSTGRYALDFVLPMATHLQAVDLETGDQGDVRLQVRSGAQLNVDIVLLGTARVVGRALAPDGTALTGAVVRITSLTNFQQFSAMTDQSGAFSISGVPVGNITIDAAHGASNSRVVVAAVLATAGGTLIQDLTLIPFAPGQVVTGTLKGQVFRSDGVTPAAGIPVFTDRGGVATSDASGSYRIDGLVAGPVTVRAIDQTRLEQANVVTTVVGGVEITANLLLFGGTGTVRGVVLDANGVPVANAQVGGGLSLVRTDATGQFTLTDVPIGQRTLTALDEARQLTATASVNLSGPGEIVTVQLVLEARSSLAGRVFEADGITPVPSLRVFVLGARNLSATTDAAGAFRFDGLPLGTYQISAFRPDFSDGNVAAAKLVFKDEVRVVNVAFRGKGRVTGTVLAADGVTALGARVGFSELQVKTGNLAPAENPRCEIQGNIQVGDVTIEVPQCVAVGIGFQSVHLTRVVNNDVSSGTFAFDAVFVGGFTVEAVNAFSPTVMAASGAIARAGDTVNVRLQLVATSAVRGTVFQPDGVTPVGPDVVVTFDSSTLRGVKVVTDAQGRYLLPLVNGGGFTVTAQDPVTGLVGQSFGAVDPGRTADVAIRLLGTGTVTVTVQGGAGAVAAAVVTLNHGGFPVEQRQRVTGADGKVTFSGGDAVAEGGFSVSAFDPATGITGFAGGTIPAPDARVNVQVLLPDQAGIVRGRFLRTDNTTGVGNAQVHLTAGGEAFAITDADGQFVFEGVRLGGFTLEAFDATTGRRGRNTGQLTSNGAVVTVDVVEVPQGTVKGFVRLSKDLSPVANADVSISLAGVFGGSLRTTSGIDGAFTFPGVSAGSFNLHAVEQPSGLSGDAAGTLATEGQEVSIDVILLVAAVGRIEGAVTTSAGSPALGAQATLDGARKTTVDNAGFYFFDAVPIGPHSLLATAAVGADAGTATVALAFDGDVSRGDIQFIGTATVTGIVKSGGGEAVVFAHVVLTRKTAVPRSFSNDTLTDGTGRFEFDGVPVGDVSVTATQTGTLLAGTASGPLGLAGLDLVVVLEPAGSLRGRVLREDGTTPAAGMALELTDGSHRFGSTGPDGRFAFDNLSLGTYTLTVTDPVGTGIVFGRAILTAQGQVADLADLILDESPPRVVSVTPSNGATGVPVSTIIQAQFSEPIDLATAGAPNLLVSGPSGAIAGTWTLSTDQTRASFTPSSPYRDFSPVSVKLGVGVRDRVGKPLAQEVVAAFTTADSQPPTFVSVSPASGARDVALESVVRVGYSEAVDPTKFVGPAVVLSLDGAPVAGRIDVILSNTVIVFTPAAPLLANRTYRVDVAPASDLFGNVQPTPLSLTFATLDTQPPVIQALTRAGGATTVVQGTTASIIADLGGATDVAFVEFLVNGKLVLTRRSAPFTFSLPVTADLGTTVSVTARATDQSGNVGPFQTLALAVQPDAPPTAAIIAPPAGATAGSGQPLGVTVRAADDFGVVQISLQATGALNALITTPVVPASTSRDASFNLVVPASAVPGSTIVLRASATDTRGQTSPVASIALVVGDSTGPTVRIVSPEPGATVTPGDTVSVLVSATDNGQVASLSLDAAGAATFSESRAVSPPQPAVAATFQVPVPVTATANQFLNLTARAQDTAGNTTPAGLSLRVRDVVPPTVVLATIDGASTVTAGRSVSVRATATDNVAVTEVDFQTEGAATQTRSTMVSPPASPATVDFTFTVPVTAADGSTVTVHARARDGAGNVSTDATLALVVAADRAPPVVTILAPADGTQIGLGQNLTLKVRATDNVAVSQIAYTATGAVTSSEARAVTPPTTPAEVSFTLSVPAGTAPGNITLTVVARDQAGNESAPAATSVTLLDTLAPTVTITSPAPGAAVDPRAPLDVTVQATDNVGVTEITLSATGAAATSETRPVSPAAASRSETFSVTFATPPPTGGALTLDARARDAAGNQGTAASVAVNVRDVVAPTVAEVSPANGAIGVDPAVVVSVRFSEPVARASVTATSVSLTTPAGAVPATIGFSDGDRVVTLAPASPLPLKTTVTAAVGTAVSDLAGNALAASFSASFTTALPDTTPPRVVSVSPADGSTDVSVAVAVQVTFTEPVDTATVTPASFSVTAGATPVAGAFAFVSGNSVVRFVPSAPLPFGTLVRFALSADITDVAGNHLADASGNPLIAPLRFAFTTGTFSITNPINGASVPENTRIVLEARGSASLGITTVTFTVNGQALPPAATPPFTTPFTTPSAATTPALTITATARDGGGSVIGQDQVVVAVVVGLRFDPRLTGVAPGATTPVRLVLTSALPHDLVVDVSAVDPALLSVPTTVTIAAGETAHVVPITGVAVGSTTVLASSSLGTAGSIVSVSPLASQQTFNVQAAPTEVSVQKPPSAGLLLAAGSGQRTVTLRLLANPAAAITPVTVDTSNPAVAMIAAGVTIAAGSTVANVTVTTGTPGVALLTLRAGTEVRGLTVIVGTPSPNSVPPLVAPPAGVVILRPPSAGQVVTAAGRQLTLTVPLLATPASQDTPVEVTSSADGVAHVVGSVVVPAGFETATLTIATGTPGTALITLRAGANIRALTVVVGTPPPGTTPPILAPPVGVVIRPPASLGEIVAGTSGQQTLTVPLLTAPASQDTPVQVTSSDAGVAHVVGSVVVPAGSRTATITIATGTGGRALLTLRAGTDVRGLTVVVGTPPPGSTPPILAPPVGLVVLTPPSAGQLIAPGTGQSALTLPLLDAPASQSTPVSVTSSDPAIATVVGSVVVPAGSRVAAVTVATGARGVAFLTFRAGGAVRELTVIVGTPSAGSVPPIVALPTGIVVQSAPSAGMLIAPGSGQHALTVPVLPTPAAQNTPVTVTSSDPAVATIAGNVSVPAGSQVATLTITMGSPGIAFIRLSAGSEVRELTVIVGTPPDHSVPPVVAPPIQIDVPSP